MITAITLFAATFAVVFLLGLQQLNVQHDHRIAAFGTSFAIAASNLVLFKVLPQPTATGALAGYMTGGAFGIIASMWAHPLLLRLFSRPASAHAAGTQAKGYAVQFGEVTRLAIQIADKAARSEIETLCLQQPSHGQRWFDTQNLPDAGAAELDIVYAARQYLALRGRLRVHPSDSRLVQFC